MLKDSVILDDVQTPTIFLALSLQRELEKNYPDQHVIEAAAWNFDFEDYADAEQTGSRIRHAETRVVALE